MKFLRFNFCHPIKGYAYLTQLSTDPSKFRTIKIDSKKSNVVEIPVDECPDGKWKVVLEWEHDGNSFSHQKEFEIKKADIEF